MFYQKTIRDLRAANLSLDKSRDRKESELSILQDAFRRGVQITNELKEQIAGLEARNEKLNSSLLAAEDKYDRIAGKYDNLSNRHDMLDSVLRQLRISINLPTGKK
jgi:chromosome segregation ATPase